MDLFTLTVFNFASSPTAAMITAAMVWAISLIMVAGLLAELADSEGMNGPVLWAVGVVVIPLPTLLAFRWVRRRAKQNSLRYDHRGTTFRRLGYRYAALAFLVLLILEFIVPPFVPWFAPLIRPFNTG